MRKRGWILVLISLVAGGWWGWQNYLQTQIKQTEELKSYMRVVQAAINPERVRSLIGNSDDLINPDYLRLKEQLTLMAESKTGIRYVYLMKMREDKVYFYVDTQPNEINGVKTDPADITGPGEFYDDASDDLKKVFYDGNVTVVGPETDKWGTFITGLIPIVDLKTNQMLAVVGADIEASDWNQKPLLATIPAILLTILLIILEIAILTFYGKQRKSREYLSFVAAVLESSTDAIFSTDLDGRVQFWNKGAEKLYGYLKDEAVGKEIKELVVPKDKWWETEKNMALIAEGKEVPQIVTERQNKKGDKLWVLLTVSPVFGEMGKVEGVSVIARNWNEQVKSENDVKKRNEELERMNEMMIDREIKMMELKKQIRQHEDK